MDLAGVAKIIYKTQTFRGQPVRAIQTLQIMDAGKVDVDLIGITLAIVAARCVAADTTEPELIVFAASVQNKRINAVAGVILVAQLWVIFLPVVKVKRSAMNAKIVLAGLTGQGASLKCWAMPLANVREASVQGLVRLARQMALVSLTAISA